MSLLPSVPKPVAATIGVSDDPLPNLEVERGPENKGVGRWVPEQKHFLLAKYIVGTRAAARKWPQRVLIDPFCGPGRIQVKGESFTRDGGAVVAWRQSQSTGDSAYTKLLVGDISHDRASACGARLKALGANVQSFVGEARATILEMKGAVPRGALCFAYLDPYNLELLTFDILQTLAMLPRVDIAVHFSTMDLRRNVEFEFDPARARFDETAPGWRDHVQVKQIPKSGLAMAFFEYWCNLVKSLGFSVSEVMPLVENDTGHPIYQLVFFSRNPLPHRIWGDVAKGPNRSFDFGD